MTNRMNANVLPPRPHGPWLGFRVAGADEPDDQGWSEAVRTQGRIGHSVGDLCEQLQCAALFDRQVRIRTPINLFGIRPRLPLH
jgi:hypothetical protein